MSKRKKTDDIHTPRTSGQVIKDYDLEEKARVLATRGEPKAGQVPTSIELEVKEDVEGRINIWRNEIDLGAQVNREQLAAIPDPESDRDLKLLPGKVTSAIVDEYSAHADDIKTTVQDEREAEAVKKGWVDRHKHLLRERTKPYLKASKLGHVAPVVGMSLGENAFTCLTFLNTTSSGLVGAYVVALMITVLNLGTAFFVGLIPLRYLNLKSWKVNLWAISALVVGVVIILGTNLVAGHYREVASTARSGFSEQKVIAHIFEHPFDLGLQSIGLALIGILLACYAAYRGYTASDPLPGFEKVWLRWLEKEDELNDLKKTMKSGFKGIKESIKDAFKPYDVSKELNSIRERYERLVNRKVRVEALEQSEIAAGDAAIERFRALNLGIRTDGIDPFGDMPVTFDNVLKATNLTSLGSEIEEVVKAHLDYAETLQKLEEECSRQIEAATDNLGKIMTLIEKSYAADDKIPDLAAVRGLVTGASSKMKWG